MLKIAVCVKQVSDPVTVEIDPLSGVINQSRLVYIINKPDLEAVELALRWREKLGGEVQVFSYGPEQVESALRECLAMGVDGVTRVKEISGEDTANALAEAIVPFQPDLVLCGNRSSDNGSGQVPGRLAERLGMVSVSGIVKAEPEGRIFKLERKLERGRREKLTLELPGLLTIEAGQVDPRYASLPDYMRAQQAVIPVFEPKSTSRNQIGLKLVAVRPPRPRPRRIFIPDPQLPAAARIQAILSGGNQTTGRKGAPVEGPAEEQAERIIEFLEKNGFLD